MQWPRPDFGLKCGHKKTLPEGRVFVICNDARVLRGDNVVGTWAFFALADFEADALVFIQRGVAVHLDLRMMHEQILAAVIGSDKTKTFACIEPLDCTCTHMYCSCPV